MTLLLVHHSCNTNLSGSLQSCSWERERDSKSTPCRCSLRWFTLICVTLGYNSVYDRGAFIIFKVIFKYTTKSRDSSVGITTRLWAGNFSLHHWVQNGSGSHPASYPTGTGGSFRGSKAAGAWSCPLIPSSAEVKNAWSYTSSPKYVFMAWCLVKHRDKFTFTTIAW
jgi:hypothetical protein